MKKVGILTINDYSNYGNRLQNYATQEVLKTLGFDADTIIYNRCSKEKSSNMINKIRKFVSLPINVKYSKVEEKVVNKLNKKLVEERIKAFKIFTQNYISETDFTISDEYIPGDIDKNYDFFVTGSDQVWHPVWGGTPIDFLSFATPQKRVAYAPSFGVSEIPQYCVDDYKKWISEIPYLSVREQVGADIIKKLTGREAVVLVDPTLMLTKDKWLSISKKAMNKPAKKYILIYCLGYMDKDIKSKIKSIAAKNNLEIVQLASLKDKRRYTADPSEFIDYIKSAELVVTDSFHGTVFSILFEKPFIVFERIDTGPSMSSRIDTLLSKFKLKSRKLENIMSEDDIFNIDFSHVASILHDERNKAINYLKTALNISELK